MDASAPADLAVDLQTRGCAVCNHLAARANEFFAHFQYALYADERARKDYTAGPGLCSVHLWQLEGVSAPVGSAVGQAPRAERIAQALEDAAGTPDRNRAMRLAPQRDRCPVCDLLREAESTYTGQLVQLVGNPGGLDLYARSHGLCLRHLALLVTAVPRNETAAALLRIAARHFRQLAVDLRSYAEKTESLHRELLTADDYDAVERALTHLGGRRSIVSS